MDIRFSAKERAFRDEVRAFVRNKVPADLKEKVARGTRLTREEATRWHRTLHERGWAAPKWPVKYGGTNWTPTQHYLFQEETVGRAPTITHFGIWMVGPVLYTYGTQQQIDRHLPSILNGDEWWCQGYSEPGAGSDLANLKTRAERDGDVYVVNGQKMWTTDAHLADMMFCLVRTNPHVKKQAGITLLLIDMRSDGVTVRPIPSVDGVHHLNEVFFDNVRVPVENRVGEQDKGWTYAKFILNHERSGAGHALAKLRLQRLKEIAMAQRNGGRRLIEDPIFRDRLAQLEIDMLCLEYTNLRILSDVQRGSAPGPESSMVKVASTAFATRVTEMCVEALGYHGAIWEPQHPGAAPDFVGIPDAVGAMEAHLIACQSMIYGGSAEIQRNIIAKSLLGL